MAIDPDIILREALTLPSDRRAKVAAELLASLDDQYQEDADLVRQTWTDELKHRANRVIAGEDPGEPWPEVRDRIRGDLIR